MTDFYHIEPNDNLVQIGDRLMRDVEVLITDEMFSQIRQGYMCLMCFQKFDSAFPKKCSMPVCEYPVADRQSEDLMRLYQGDLEQTWTASQEELNERSREEYERKGIWLPNTASVG